MHFFKILKLSFTNPQAYAIFALLPFRVSLWFVVRCYLFLFFLAMIALFPITQHLSKTLMDAYPQDLVLTYTEGKLTTQNKTLPIEAVTPFIPLIGTGIFHLYEDNITLTLWEQTVPLRYQEVFSEDVSFTITAQGVSLHAYTAIAIALVSFGSITGVVGVFGHTVSLILYSAVLSFIMRFSGKRIAFIKLVQIGMHVMVVAEVVNILSALIYTRQTLPMFDITFTGLYLLILWSMRKSFLK